MTDSISPLGHHCLPTWIPPSLSVHPAGGHRFALSPLPRSGTALDNTGLLVSKLCFGTMTFGDGSGLFKGIRTVGQAGPDETVKA
jgi:hypothetical protein